MSIDPNVGALKEYLPDICRAPAWLRMRFYAGRAVPGEGGAGPYDELRLATSFHKRLLKVVVPAQVLASTII